jgi:Zn-dependent protease with chaperone function
MAQSGSKKPAELLSSHPSDKTRIDDLSKLIPTVMPLYEQAKTSK